MSLFIDYWKEFYLTIGGLVVLCILIAVIMDYRDYRRKVKSRKDWWKD